MSRFEELQVFVQVVESGSLTAAAERLGMAKSAVSRRLAELEQRLGVELIHRTTRRLALTDSGRAFHERSVGILSDLEEAEDAVTRAHKELQGPLRVAAPLSFGLLHLGPTINDFITAHPRIQVTLDLNDRRIDLVQEGVDVAIRIGTLQDSSLIARRLAPIARVTLASPAYLRRHGEPRTPEELSAHRCLVYSYGEPPGLWSYRDRAGNPRDVRVQPYLEANNGTFLSAAAIAGHGITHQPRFIAWEAIQRGELVPILTEYSIDLLHAYAIYPPTRHLSQRVRTLVDFLAERFRVAPYCAEGAGNAAD